MKRIINYYVLGGQGIGMRFVLLIACFFALLFSISSYVVLSKKLDLLDSLFSHLPQVTILDGKIISPVYTSQKFHTMVGDIEFNTASVFVNPAELMTQSKIYITQTQILIYSFNENYVPDRIQKISKPFNTPGGMYREIQVNKLEDQVFSVQGFLKKAKSLIALGNILIGIIIFIMLLADFLLTYLIVLFINFFLRLSLTAAQLGRLLVVPWGILVSGSFILTAMKKTLVLWWISCIVRSYTPVIPVGRAHENLMVYVMPMWWLILVLLFVVFIIYFMWASSLSLYKERRDEELKKRKSL